MAASRMIEIWRASERRRAGVHRSICTRLQTVRTSTTTESVASNFPVLCETHTLVLRRLGGKFSANWLSEILSGSLPMNPEANDHLDACGDLRKYSDHPITVVDSLLARLTGKLGVPVWTFDRHFTTMRTSVCRSTLR
jgi:hypothetical protein